MRIFVTGGTGYVGRRLVRALLELGHEVRVLVRAESVSRVPPGAVAVVGDALDAPSFQHELREGDTLVHLVGTPQSVARHWGPGTGGRWCRCRCMRWPRLVPATRAGALRLGLVRLDQMVNALVRAVAQPPAAGTMALVDVEGIRAA